jgi:hypothetical protein
MKRAIVVDTLQSNSHDVVVPTGPCWIIEGELWTTIYWDSEGERRSFEFSRRDYRGYVDRGSIHAGNGKPQGLHLR